MGIEKFSLSEIIAIYSGFSLWDEREQNKFFWDLYNFYVSPIDRVSFQAMAFFAKAPSNESERAFNSIREDYISALANFDSAPKWGNPPRIPSEESLICAAKIAWRWAEANEGSTFLRVMLCNVCFVRNGLPAMQFSSALMNIYSFNPGTEPEAIARLLLQSKPPRPIPKRAVTKDDLLGVLSKVMPDGVEKCYLYGSYARGLNTPGSDADLAILFKKGFSPDDKKQMLSSIRESLMAHLQVFSDFIEIAESSQSPSCSIEVTRNEQ